MSGTALTLPLPLTVICGWVAAVVSPALPLAPQAGTARMAAAAPSAATSLISLLNLMIESPFTSFR